VSVFYPERLNGTMATMNISLPDPMREFIEERVTEKGYTTTSEYFRNLVCEDQKRKAQEKLEALLLEGLESGTPIEVTEEYVQRKRAELLARMQKSVKGAS
jgi:antitoxin ParD1/3/4